MRSLLDDALERNRAMRGTEIKPLKAHSDHLRFESRVDELSFIDLVATFERTFREIVAAYMADTNRSHAFRTEIITHSKRTKPTLGRVFNDFGEGIRRRDEVLHARLTKVKRARDEIAHCLKYCDPLSIDLAPARDALGEFLRLIDAGVAPNTTSGPASHS